MFRLLCAVLVGAVAYFATAILVLIISDDRELGLFWGWVFGLLPGMFIGAVYFMTSGRRASRSDDQTESDD
jgi:hypothetical protein